MPEHPALHETPQAAVTRRLRSVLTAQAQGALIPNAAACPVPLRASCAPPSDRRLSLAITRACPIRAQRAGFLEGLAVTHRPHDLRRQVPL